MDDYDYCEKCGEYMGFIVNDYFYSGDSINNNKDSYNMENQRIIIKLKKHVVAYVF